MIHFKSQNYVATIYNIFPCVTEGAKKHGSTSDSILHLAYMSSEDEEQQPDGQVEKVVKVLPWESDAMREIKSKLDDLYTKNATSPQKKMMRIATKLPSCPTSARKQPNKAPNWAVKASQ